MNFFLFVDFNLFRVSEKITFRKMSYCEIIVKRYEGEKDLKKKNILELCCINGKIREY
jgi:hypothetical protein